MTHFCCIKILFLVFFSLQKNYLQISAERMIKTISELRHKICQARQNLENETEVNLNRIKYCCIVTGCNKEKNLVLILALFSLA